MEGLIEFRLLLDLLLLLLFFHYSVNLDNSMSCHPEALV